MDTDLLLPILEQIKVSDDFMVVARRVSTAFYVIEITTKSRTTDFEETTALQKLMDDNEWKAGVCKRLTVTNPDHPELGRPYLEIDSVYLTRQQADRIFLQ